MAPLALGGALLHPGWRDAFVRGGLQLCDAASEASFQPLRLAPTVPDSELTPFDRFPLNSYLVDDPEVDLDAWRLTVSGLVEQPGEYALDDIRRLPRVVQNTRHICIEGWDVVGRFGGTRIADFLDAIGADQQARYVEVACADDYYESIDMASARHPQSLLCDEMYDRPLSRGHGAPLRLVMPTKLGYKQVKYIVGLRVTSVLGPRRGYWEDQGYSWHGGI